MTETTDRAGRRRVVPKIITYCNLPYNGKGPAQSCVSILANFPSDLVSNELAIPRITRPLPASISVTQTVSEPFRRIPWKYIKTMAYRSLDRYFVKAIDAADPASTVAYFWPDPPMSLLHRAKARGILTVREMINCYRGTAKRILDDAYAVQGLPPTHRITDESIEVERRQLLLYDYVFASNQVEPTLIEAGVDPRRILPTSFGWSPSRFPGAGAERRSTGFTALFVGTVSIRKGVPQLLQAWKRSGVVGTLKIAGAIDPDMIAIIEPYRGDPSIEFVGFRNGVHDLYREADLFVFPSLEEGGPQVVYEAAGCGLPVIATPMGAGRMVRNGVNGLIVEAGDVHGLAAAISDMASSPEKRRAFSERGMADSSNFTYEKIGYERACMMIDVLRHRRN